MEYPAPLLYEPKLILPPQWQEIERYGNGAQYVFTNLITRQKTMSVIITAEIQRDGKRWLHVSMARANRVPDWQEIKLVKSLFIGDDKTALQVFPPKSQFVNIHEFCLHLWHCLDGDVTPNFAHMENGRLAI